MSVEWANEEFLKLCERHCRTVQGGSFGVPTIADLEFIGKIHKLIEEGV